VTAAGDKVAILCGGRGTRLRGGGPGVPKPLVEVGRRPIVWHVIQIYASQGHRDFLLLTGHRGEEIAEWARNAELPAEVSVRCVDTGADTATGGRIKRAADELSGGPFQLTYADGLADVDLAALAETHSREGRVATVTVVQPTLQFGVAELGPEDRVLGFSEKPRIESWINGGFFWMEPEILDRLSEDSVLEEAPLEGLAADGELTAYRHAGFWGCMDTYKDAALLNDLWATGDPPWRVWAEEPV
jgi:glucose-1-phosphate cytidylyltransferase